MMMTTTSTSAATRRASSREEEYPHKSVFVSMPPHSFNLSSDFSGALDLPPLPTHVADRLCASLSPTFTAGHSVPSLSGGRASTPCSVPCERELHRQSPSLTTAGIKQKKACSKHNHTGKTRVSSGASRHANERYHTASRMNKSVVVPVGIQKSMQGRH